MISDLVHIVKIDNSICEILTPEFVYLNGNVNLKFIKVMLELTLDKIETNPMEEFIKILNKYKKSDSRFDISLDLDNSKKSYKLTAIMNYLLSIGRYGGETIFLCNSEKFEKYFKDVEIPKNIIVELTDMIENAIFYNISSDKNTDGIILVENDSDYIIDIVNKNTQNAILEISLN